MSQWNRSACMWELVDITLKSTGQTLHGRVTGFKGEELILDGLSSMGCFRTIPILDIKTMDIADNNYAKEQKYKNSLDDSVYASTPSVKLPVPSSSNEISMEMPGAARPMKRALLPDPPQRNKHKIRVTYQESPRKTKTISEPSRARRPRNDFNAYQPIKIKISDGSKVTHFYRTKLGEMHQLTCRAITEAWIKLLEPKMDSNFPYNRDDGSKPDWWPKNIRYREPDRLLNDERLELLLVLLQCGKIPISELEAATSNSKYEVASKMHIVAGDIPLLEELYAVAKHEELYKKGVLSPNAIVHVMLSDTATGKIQSPEPVNAPFGTRTSFKGADRIGTRLGISLDHQRWRTEYFELDIDNPPSPATLPIGTPDLPRLKFGSTPKPTRSPPVLNNHQKALYAALLGGVPMKFRKNSPHSISFVEEEVPPIPSTRSETQTIEFVCPDGYAMSEVSVTEETWEETRNSLPEDLRWSVYFENNCWTLFRDPRDIKSTIPLRIAGAPLIIPVYSPPWVHSGTVSLPDPHPKLINPRAELTDKMVISLFESFPCALAFYILYNGFCQIWVDDDFDFKWAASHFPREFGGLRVSYFTHGPSATSGLPGPSGLSHVQSTFENTSHESISSGSQNIALQISTTPTMKCGSEIEVKSPTLSTIVGRSLRSRVGVSILMEGELVITMTSHGAIAPRIQEKIIGEKIKKYGFWNRYLTKFLGRGGNDRNETQQPKDLTKWWEGVEVFAAGTDKKVGDLWKTYDEEASEDTLYPIGFPYDISLIRPSQNKRMIGGIMSPASEWYRDGALDTKSRLYVIGSHQIDGHGLPRRWSEPVGQGIMLNQGGLPPEQKWKVDDVKRLVSRCTLWRPLNATAGWDGWSGAPVIVKKEDGTESLLGFQSFVQDSHHRQFPMPDDKLKEACTDGYISFGACMKLPEDVLNSVIVR